VATADIPLSADFFDHQELLIEGERNAIPDEAGDAEISRFA
jgi:hypothetical protein